MSVFERGAEVFQCGFLKNEGRERAPHTAADVSIFKGVKHTHTHTQRKTCTCTDGDADESWYAEYAW